MTYPESATYPTPADKFFTALIAVLLLCAASFYAGRVTAPVRTRVRFPESTPSEE